MKNEIWKSWKFWLAVIAAVLAIVAIILCFTVPVFGAAVGGLLIGLLAGFIWGSKIQK